MYSSLVSENIFLGHNETHTHTHICKWVCKCILIEVSFLSGVQHSDSVITEPFSDSSPL